MQGERRAETRSSYAEPQPSLAVASQMQWQSYDIAEPHCLTVTDLAKLFLKKLQKCVFFTHWGYHNAHTHSEVLPRAGGYPQTPFLLLSLAQRKKQRNIHPLQGLPLYGEDAIDLGPCPKSKFWYDSQSFRPSGVSHGDDDYASRWSSFCLR